MFEYISYNFLHQMPKSQFLLKTLIVKNVSIRKCFSFFPHTDNFSQKYWNMKNRWALIEILLLYILWYTLVNIVALYMGLIICEASENINLFGEKKIQLFLDI